MKSISYLIFSVILSTSTTFSLQAQGQSLSKNSSIAIVGAGPAGLSAAYQLEKNGYNNITIFEAESMVGGKVFTNHIGTQNVEQGAVWVTTDYKNVLEFAKAVNITPSPYVAKKILVTKDGEHVDFGDNLKANFSTAEIGKSIAAFFALDKTVNDTANGYNTNYLVRNLDLTLTAEKYLELHPTLVPIFDAYRSFFVASGYGYYDQVPMLYYWALMKMILKATLKEKVNEAAKHELFEGLMYFPQGFQEIWIKLASDVLKKTTVKLSEPVTNLRTVPEFAKVAVTTSKGKYQFDKVIVTTSPGAVKKFLDPNNFKTELEYISYFKSYRFVVSAVELGDLPKKEAYFFDSATDSSRIGDIAIMANRWDDDGSNLYAAYQIVPWEWSPDQVIAHRNQQIEEFGGTILPKSEMKLPQVPPRDVNYFPYFPTDILQAKWPYKYFDSIQGKDGVFYAGNWLSFESVEFASGNARNLVNKFFK